MHDMTELINLPVVPNGLQTSRFSRCSDVICGRQLGSLLTRATDYTIPAIFLMSRCLGYLEIGRARAHPLFCLSPGSGCLLYFLGMGAA